MNFDQAVAYVNSNKKLSESLTEEEILDLYGLYKQATIGDNTNPQPGMFDFRGNRKWNAWNERRGIKMNVAKELYAKRVNALKFAL